MNTVENDFAAVATLLRGLCKDDLLHLAMQTRLDTLPGMDSLKSLQAVALLEEQFRIQIDLEALDRPLRTVEDIVKLVRAVRQNTPDTPRDQATAQ